MTTSSVDREVLRAWRDNPTADMIPAVVAAELCDVSYRQMDHWIRKGYVRILERRKDKSGVDRWIGAREWEVLQVFVCLVDAGVSPRVASGLVRGDLVSVAALEAALRGCRRVSAPKEEPRLESEWSPGDIPPEVDDRLGCVEPDVARALRVKAGEVPA